MAPFVTHFVFFSRTFAMNPENRSDVNVTKDYEHNNNELQGKT